jgi:hypothetical protein
MFNLIYLIWFYNIFSKRKSQSFFTFLNDICFFLRMNSASNSASIKQISKGEGVLHVKHLNASSY